MYSFYSDKKFFSRFFLWTTSLFAMCNDLRATEPPLQLDICSSLVSSTLDEMLMDGASNIPLDPLPDFLPISPESLRRYKEKRQSSHMSLSILPKIEQIVFLENGSSPHPLSPSLEDFNAISPESLRRYKGKRRTSRVSIHVPPTLIQKHSLSSLPEFLDDASSCSDTGLAVYINDKEIPTKITVDPSGEVFQELPVNLDQVTVLSIDGGGIRGLIPAYGLTKIEEQIGKNSNKIFDVAIGTSAGAIIAAGIACGISAERILDLFSTHSKEIFYSSTWRKIRTLNGLLGARYSSKKFRTILTEIFGDKKLSKLEGPELIITAVDYETDELQTFSSYDAKIDPKNNDRSIVECILASTAAPYYFPSVNINNKILVDGGVAANNPTVLGITAAIKQYQRSDGAWDLNNQITVVSLGTGEADPTSKPKKDAGLLNIANGIVSHLMGGQEDHSEKAAKELVKKIYRLQPRLNKKIPLDDISEKSQSYLIQKAEKFFNQDNLKFNKVLEVLRSTKKANFDEIDFSN